MMKIAASSKNLWRIYQTTRRHAAE